jgi:ferredoxin-NADP reductase
LSWRGAPVLQVQRETVRASRIVLDPPAWPGHQPGQHLDVRLTAPDGYTAQRSYSIASAPESPTVDLVVQRLDDGEVPPYLTDGLQAGDQLELRGPIGGYFVWHAEHDSPLQLVAGGSGIAPFLAMLGHHAAASSTVAVRLLYSARTQAAVIDADRLAAHARRGVDVTITLTRTPPGASFTRQGRVDEQLLEELVWPVGEHPQIFVCGPTTFVESVASRLVTLGHAAQSIKTERFG